MPKEWRRHGTDFPALLYIAAYSLVGANFDKVPKVKEFKRAPREIDGFDLWQALRNLYIWFKVRYSSFPFSKPSVFLEPYDFDVVEIAKYLFEMTSLRIEGNLPVEERKPPTHYGSCEYHLGLYTDTLNAFLNHLYFATDFDQSILGQQEQIVEQISQAFNTLLQPMIPVLSSPSFLSVVRQFAATLKPTAIVDFVQFLTEKMPFPSTLNEEIATKWIAEFRKLYPESERVIN